MIVVIGAGRVGTALRDHSKAAGQPCELVSRRRGWRAVEKRAGSPIVLAVRNDDLDAVLERIPSRRHDDLVLIQNGMLRPWQQKHGLERITRGLLFFAVARKGDPIDPGGESPFTGKHARKLCQWFEAMELPAKVVDGKAFAQLELEKLIWNSAFGLLCERHDAPVGDIVDRHEDELRVLVIEMLAVGEPALGVMLDPDELLERLSSYSRTIPSYQGGVKEWGWRNGWFVEQAETRGIAMPFHEELLTACGYLE